MTPEQAQAIEEELEKSYQASLITAEELDERSAALWGRVNTEELSCVMEY